MRRRIKILVACGLLLLITAVPRQGFGALPPECDQNFGEAVIGIGTRAQSAIHYRLFINRYHSPANRNPDGTLADRDGGCRDDKQGLVSFAGTSDPQVIRAILFRHVDSLRRLYLFYGLGRPLTAVEKYRAESQLGAGRFLGVPYQILHLPMWVEGLAVGYNLGCPTGNPDNRLHLTAAALGQIFSGTSPNGLPIKWSDPVIAATNPDLDGDPIRGVASCDQPVRAAVRADSSDQTSVFKDYLSKQNPQFKPLMEAKVNTQWPATLLDPCRGREDGGMANCVLGQSGSIGYVSFAEAFKQGLQLAAVVSRSGTAEMPTLQGCTAAADPITNPTAGYPSHGRDQWSQVSLTDPPIGYPICSLQYALAFELMKFSYLQEADTVSEYEVATVKTYLRWTLLEASQRELHRYGLARLPESLRSRAEGWTTEIVFAP